MRMSLQQPEAYLAVAQHRTCTSFPFDCHLRSSETGIFYLNRPSNLPLSTLLNAPFSLYEVEHRDRVLLGLPTVPYFPERPVSWPHCPASRPKPSRDAKCPVFGRAQIVLKWCSKRMRDRNVLASKFKLGQLILRKIIKIVATRCNILKLKCIKFDFGWRSALESAGELTALPQTP